MGKIQGPLIEHCEHQSQLKNPATVDSRRSADSFVRVLVRPFSETRGQGCPRSFRALLESAVGRIATLPPERGFVSRNTWDDAARTLPSRTRTNTQCCCGSESRAPVGGSITGTAAE